MTDGGDVTAVDLTHLDVDTPRDREFVETVPTTDIDTEVLHDSTLDLDKVEWPVDERHLDDSELIEAIDPDIPGVWDSYEDLAETLADLMQVVGSHDHTTPAGAPRPARDLLCFMSELNSVLADSADMPLAHLNRRILVLSAERMDSTESLHNHVEETSTEGIDIGGDDSTDDDPDAPGGALSDRDDGDDGDDPGGVSLGSSSTDTSTRTESEVTPEMSTEDSESDTTADADADTADAEESSDSGEAPLDIERELRINALVEGIEEATEETADDRGGPPVKADTDADDPRGDGQ